MPDTASTSPKFCPTCGTRLSENATRCLVCGSIISDSASGHSAKSVQGTRVPEVSLSLPAAFGFLAFFLIVSAIMLFFMLRGPSQAAAPTAAPTATNTATATVTFTPTPTATPAPTFTPLPPVSYTVVSGDTCTSIAANFHVSVQSIVLSNNLPQSCDTISPGQVLSIPQPTPTASPMPSATLAGAEATSQACEKKEYEVEEGDTLASIARSHNVSVETIQIYNGLVNDRVFAGTKLFIPLCEQASALSNNATRTPTTLPNYPAPSLLLPANGALFNTSDTVALQWASVGTLGENEAYAVTVEDMTALADSNQPRKIVEYVTDTKLILPASFRPTDAKPHLINWSVLPVRQNGKNQDGSPIWEPAGKVSEKRGLIWSGGIAPQAPSTPTP